MQRTTYKLLVFLVFFSQYLLGTGGHHPFGWKMDPLFFDLSCEEYPVCDEFICSVLLEKLSRSPSSLWVLSSPVSNLADMLAEKSPILSVTNICINDLHHVNMSTSELKWLHTALFQEVKVIDCLILTTTPNCLHLALDFLCKAYDCLKPGATVYIVCLPAVDSSFTQALSGKMKESSWKGFFPEAALLAPSISFYTKELVQLGFYNVVVEKHHLKNTTYQKELTQYFLAKHVPTFRQKDFLNSFKKTFEKPLSIDFIKCTK